MTEDRPRLPTLDELWERSAHGTHREDLQAAYDLGKAEGIQQERALASQEMDRLRAERDELRGRIANARL